MENTATGDLLAGLREIAEVGADGRRGGYSRHLWQPAEMELREWFIAKATGLGLEVETDRNGNIWAWWGLPGKDAVVVGSHLDSVPGGGAFDGPLGVASALEVVRRLQAAGATPRRPVAVLVFAEEEGSRFGVACLGSQLMTGQLDPQAVLGLTDSEGRTFAEAGRFVGFPVERIGADPEALSRIGVFIELHIEQGQGLIELDSPVGVASSILAHGRWSLSFRGQGNHAGSTLMQDRDDPMIAAARAVLEVERAALEVDGARATVGRITAFPGGSNVIPSSVMLTLDVRAGSDDQTRALVSEISRRVGAESFVENSWSPEVRFDPHLAKSISELVGQVPILPTGAGHDAGILSAVVPTAMVFVRNPTGISHAPEEHADLDDCIAGVDALEKVVRSLIS